MATRESIDNIIVNGVGQKGAFDHKLDGTFSTVSIEPTLSLRFAGILFVSTGVNIGTMISSNYSQLQQISEPAGKGTFLDKNGDDSHKRTRNEYSGKLPNPLTIISPMIGASAEFPLNIQRTMLIVSEIFYQIGLTNILKDITWKTNILRLGLSLKYSPGKKKEIPSIPIQEEKKEEAPVVITEIPKKNEQKPIDTPKVQIVAVGVEPKGIEVPNPILRIEEFTSTIMTSLLNYIFFAPNSSEILPRYTRLDKNQTEDFTPEKVNSADKLSTYYYILNIIGKRMQQKPTSKITLTGCVNDYAEEKGNLTLARNRAERIKSYIMNVWGISPTRITVKEQLLPAKPSNVMTTDGSEENRRVEITTDDEELLAPIITNDTLRTVNYPIIRFKPIVPSEIDSKQWTITAAQNSRTIKEFSGKDAPPPKVDWQLSDKSTIPRYSAPVEFTFAVKDEANTVIKNSGELQIDIVSLSKKRSEKRGDMEIDMYSLILFDVKSAELTPANKSIMQLIKPRIKKDASVVVMGYTDRVGELTFNLSLAESRAKSIAAFLGKSYDVTTVSKGNSNLYDNNLPEGRFYSRTVEIEVQTPVKY